MATKGFKLKSGTATVETTPISPAEVTTVTIADAGLSAAPARIRVGVYKLNPVAEAPEYATDGSMCFDIKACLTIDTVVTGYNKMNEKFTRHAVLWTSENGPMIGVSVDPGDRVMIPTGLIFDLPSNTAMILYPRSGFSLKQGMKLGNCVGVVDSDYVEQTFVILENTSSVRVYVMHGERICQGEVVETPPQAMFTELSERPAQKTSRNGGFGSTGK